MMRARLSPLLRRFRRAEAGAVAVEFAFVIPVFVVFCLGIIEVGRAMWIRNSIQTATEEAGRFAMAHTTATDATLVSHAEDYFDAVGADEPVFVVAHDTVGGVNFVTVSGTYTFNSMFSFIDIFDVTLDGQSRVPLVPS